MLFERFLSPRAVAEDHPDLFMLEPLVRAGLDKKISTRTCISNLSHGSEFFALQSFTGHPLTSPTHLHDP